MRIAYADPPYVGQAKRYPEKQEIDHQKLIFELETYDGWAVSASSPSLKYILSLCPDNVRIGAWIKPFCAFKPNVNPAYAWEPVIFKPARGYTRDEPTIRDWIKHNITLKQGVIGAKPYEFCFWIFRILGARGDEDEFFDLFPGTGIVTKAWNNWKMSDDFNRWIKKQKLKHLSSQ